MDYEYLCANLGSLWGLATRVYNGSELLYSYSKTDFIPDPAMPVFERIWQNRRAVSYYDILGMLYVGAVKIKKDNFLVVLGPVSQIQLDESCATMVLGQLGQPHARCGEFLEYLRGMPGYSLKNFLRIVCFVNYILNDEKVSVYDLIRRETDAMRINISNDNELWTWSGSDTTLAYSTYETERAMLSLIATGQPAALEEMLGQPAVWRLGKTAGSELRQRKNTFISSATLAGWAAILGGLAQEAAFSKSDLYIQKAELFNDCDQLISLNVEMLLDFARQVETINCHGSRSKLVMDVSRFVTDNIDKKLTTAAIAAHLKMGRSYFCQRFKREAGITVNTFVTEQKLLWARRLLTTTNHSIIQISEYLCFSSQGYFQNVFKKHVGCTPREYREQPDQTGLIRSA